MKNREIMLQINQLKCGYKHAFYISDITYNVPQGALTGIIGPNGSGKTTLFRGLTSELEIELGSVILDGKNIPDMTHRERARKLAIVTQEIDEVSITVENYVLMGRTPYHSQFQFFETKEDYRVTHKYLHLTDTYHLKDKYMHQLSGGEKQLAAITRALTQEPELLLLDESTSHLDITHQVEILNLIQRLNNQLGLTVLIILHDLNLASEYCDNLIMMNNGKIHIAGDPRSVLTYKTIEEVYNTVIVTKTNPLSERPAIFLVSENAWKNVQE